MDDPFAMSNAVGFEGAIGAARIFRYAKEGAEFHKGLVKVGAGVNGFSRVRVSGGNAGYQSQPFQDGRRFGIS